MLLHLSIGAFHAKSIKIGVKVTWLSSIFLNLVFSFMTTSVRPTNFYVSLTFRSRDRSSKFDPTLILDHLPGVITPLLGDLHMWCWCHFKVNRSVYLFRQFIYQNLYNIYFIWFDMTILKKNVYSYSWKYFTNQPYVRSIWPSFSHGQVILMTFISYVKNVWIEVYLI